MKKSIALLSIFLGSLLFAQNSNEATFQKIVENSFQEVWSDLDETKINNYYSDDFMLFEDGEILNLDSVKNYVQSSKQMFNSEENKAHQFERINRFEFLKSGSEGNLGWITYHNYAEFKMNGNVISTMHWLESANFVQTKDGWKMIFLHSTPFKESK